MKIKIRKILIVLKKPTTLLLSSLIVLLMIGHNAYSQDTEYKKGSIMTGVGVGINEGKRETGMGVVYAIGWQKNIGERTRLRINPTIIFGGFSPMIVTDTRDHFTD